MIPAASARLQPTGRSKAQKPRVRSLPGKFVTDGQLVVVGGRNILFSPAQQAIVEVNDMAAYIWRSLEEGITPETMSTEVEALGVDATKGGDYIRSALREWDRLGFIRPASPMSSASTSGEWHCRQDIGVAGLQVRIDYATGFARAAVPIFQHLETRETAPDILLEVVEQDRRLHLYRNGEWVLSCSPAELPTALKGQLLIEVLKQSAYEIALHAASLVQDHRMLLVCGSPGAGKTTLTLALVHAGFGFAGDDLALLDSDGRAIGVPFAPAVKTGAWSLVARFRPDVNDAPIFRRPDRRRVRYLPPQGLESTEPRPVGWLVLLQRQSDGSPVLTPIDPTDALRGLLDGAFALGHRLSAMGFEALARVVGTAASYRLTYSSLEDAVDLLRKACR
jgi:hypothetical protein